MKFLCQLKWSTFEHYEFDDEESYEVNHSEIKEMTVIEMNDFVKNHNKSKVKILKKIIPTKTLLCIFLRATISLSD